MYQCSGSRTITGNFFSPGSEDLVGGRSMLAKYASSGMTRTATRNFTILAEARLVAVFEARWVAEVELLEVGE